MIRGPWQPFHLAIVLESAALSFHTDVFVVPSLRQVQCTSILAEKNTLKAQIATMSQGGEEVALLREQVLGRARNARRKGNTN